MANSFDVKTSRAIGTAATSVGSYTVPSGKTTVVIGLSIANISNEPVTVSATVFDGTTSYAIVKSAPLPVGSTLVAIGGDQKVVLPVGYSIRVSSSLASSVDAIMSILETS